MTFDELFRKFYVPLVIFADRTLRDRQVSENVVQDVFAKVWQQFGEMSGKSDLKRYLFVMVRNRVMDEMRRRRVEQRYLSEAAGLLREPVEENVFEIDLYERLYEAIEQLPRRNGEVMRLKLMGMSNEDIAARLGIKYETVHSHLQHGVASLREKFDRNLLSLLFL